MKLKKSNNTLLFSKQYVNYYSHHSLPLLLQFTHLLQFILKLKYFKFLEIKVFDYFLGETTILEKYLKPNWFLNLIIILIRFYMMRVVFLQNWFNYFVILPKSLLLLKFIINKYNYKRVRSYFKINNNMTYYIQ